MVEERREGGGARERGKEGMRGRDGDGGWKKEGEGGRGEGCAVQ